MSWLFMLVRGMTPLLHSPAMVAQQILQRCRGKHGRGSGQARGCDRSLQAADAVAGFTAVALEDRPTTQSLRAQRKARRRSNRGGRRRDSAGFVDESPAVGCTAWPALAGDPAGLELSPDR